MITNEMQQQIICIIRENLSGVTSTDPDIRAAQEDDLMRIAKLIAAALTPARQVDAEQCGDKACLACLPAATTTAQEAVPVAWGESYDGGAFFNTVSLTKTKHHTYPLYSQPPQPSVSVEGLAWAGISRDKGPND